MTRAPTFADARAGLAAGDQLAIVAALAAGRVQDLPPELALLALPARRAGRTVRFGCPVCGLPRPAFCLIDVRGRLMEHNFIGDCCWTEWVRRGAVIAGAPMTRARWNYIATNEET